MKNQNVSGNEIEQIGQSLMSSFFSTLVVGAIIIISVFVIFVHIVKKQKRRHKNNPTKRLTKKVNTAKNANLLAKMPAPPPPVITKQNAR